MLRLILAAGLALAAAPALADPVLGLWKTKPDDNGNFGQVEIVPCGAMVCGTLVKAFDAAGKPMASANVGKRIVWDMQPRGNGKYGGGKVWAPDRDKTYSAKMELNGDTLAVSGCVTVFCRAQEWTRAK
ncbi:DUF2147 domain-containing protein [Ruixingdingia sedimenti]|uniref:DUF2147 domain-containing protein n=1 Tax=Ruixingdingia sedimenti TaxID=3073604 RepID=A0ABU1F600_9RHOB|nr:DUF2147 domain-containing protein [Xinfangfangia sp. LG-4]MDR5652305.1 DUF2147 domain-containing protein [Xinfangfangia sp. LG-4]